MSILEAKATMPIQAQGEPPPVATTQCDQDQAPKSRYEKDQAIARAFRVFGPRYLGIAKLTTLEGALGYVTDAQRAKAATDFAEVVIRVLNTGRVRVNPDFEPRRVILAYILLAPVIRQDTKRSEIARYVFDVVIGLENAARALANNVPWETIVQFHARNLPGAFIAFAGLVPEAWRDRMAKADIGTIDKFIATLDNCPTDSKFRAFAEKVCTKLQAARDEEVARRQNLD